MGRKSDLDALPGEKLDRNYTELLLNNIHDGVFFANNECQIFFWNKGAEEITGFDQSHTKGRICSDHILNPVDEAGKSLCNNDCPFKLAIADGDIHTMDAFIHHKEGYRLPVSIRAFPLMKRSGKIIAAVETFFETSPKFSLPQRKIELEKMQLLDKTTEVGNKRFLEKHLQTRLEEIKEYRLPFGLLCIDVDRLQEINETYGKSVGDQTLRVVSQTILNNIRFFDIMGRWDSDEFLVILLNVDENKLDFVANKLRLLVESSNIMIEDNRVHVTISIGASLAHRVDSLEILVDRAESLMKHSKWLGRNRVSLRVDKEE